jgi:murein DD-endopeptidase MepM/ murein hydrolase activator NlpD
VKAGCLAPGAAVLAAALALGCASAPRPRPPPVPLTTAEPHVEPDLVGSMHVVKKGETVYRIARTYGIEVRDLMEVNDLADPRLLQVGMELFVPGAVRPLDVPPLPPGVMPEPEPEPQAMPRAPPKDPSLRWPLQGVLYSRFGVRQGQRHDGIDIAAPEGTPVTAAAGGTVVYTGRQSGYGAIVILRHSNGLVTLYAHNSAVLVKEGDEVAAGTPIAKVGQSGRTTGPHLHFEVRDGTRPRNPLFYLP